MRGCVFPELLGGPEGQEPMAWHIRPGTSRRGGASCDVERRILEVPLEATPQARVVRAHELMHARVSPRVEHMIGALGEVTVRALECAEECRINTLLARASFDVSLLCDGSEGVGSQRAAESDQWSEVVCFLAAVLGTGSERAFFAGVRRVRPEWMPALRAVAKQIRVTTLGMSTVHMASVVLQEGVPQGYALCTVEIARVLTRALSAAVPQDSEGLRLFRRSLVSGARRAPNGQFASLVVATGELTLATPRGSQNHWHPSTVGRVLRYPNRWVDDPHRRVFARRRRRNGGVVVVDQSGSMDLSSEEITELLRASPGALVIGYSHRPGDVAGRPNAWILARDGRVDTQPPSSNVGNGVDGPALEWAISLRRRGEPLVWVTDGQVTDANDHPSDHLTRVCARLVLRHRICLARDFAEARLLIQSGILTAPTRWHRFGRVGRAVLEAHSGADFTRRST